jgi:hypothetical protein
VESNKFTANDIPEILNKMTENTETTANAVPGTEVTQTPGLIPETQAGIPGYDPNTATAPTEYDPASANVSTAVPPTDYAAAVDHQVDTMGTSVPPNTSGVGGQEADAAIGAQDQAALAHQEMMKDPNYAVHIHEHQLDKISRYLEEIVERLISLEKKMLDHEAEYEHRTAGPDPNDVMKDYPEVRSPGLTS